ncbi:MAG: S9 family peptidase [Pseudomonadota bacterium]
MTRNIHAGWHAFAAATLVLSSSLACAAHHEGPPVFDRMDVFDLEYAADPQVSPFGDKVIYVRRANDVMRDRTVGSLWVIDVESGAHRPLITDEGSVASPRWSPDGERLAYLAGSDAGPVIRVRWLDSGETANVATLKRGPQGLTWSPDGRHLAFAMDVDASTKPLAAPPPAPKGAEWAPAAKYIDHTYYRADGAGMLQPSFTHVFVVPADGGTPHQLTDGDFNHGAPVFTPDGSAVLFSADRSADWEQDPQESEIWRLSLKGGALTQLTSDRDGPDTSPRPSPDGRQIAYLGFDDKRLSSQQTRLYLMNADGSDPRPLTDDFDRSVGNIQWGDDGNLWFQFDDHGRTHVAAIRPDGKDRRVVAEDLGGTTLGRPYTSGGFSVAGGTIAYTSGSGALRPADIYVRRGEREQRMTMLNEDLLGHRALGRVERLTWKSSADELEIEGWLVYPPHYEKGKTYPLILEIHGGPHSAYGPVFSAEVQLYAAAGHFVLYTNPRGSTSYGQAFAQEIHHAYPGEDYDDLMSGVDAVVARGMIDEDQLYVTGGSGGGVLTAWIVGKTDRFRAAVVAKPVINWLSFSLTADGYPYFTRYWFASMPWEDPDSYWVRSPLSLVGNVKTPTMLLTGEQDYRTPISESEQYYQALKLRGVDTAMVRIPGASHGIARRPSQLIAKVDNILAWFERHAPSSEAAR